MIRHTVAFTLKHPLSFPEAQRFLADARVLASLPMVKQFEQLQQLSAKNSFQYGFSMEFDDRAAYGAYNTYPVHVRFVEDRWQTEVADFMELDYVPL